MTYESRTRSRRVWPRVLIALVVAVLAIAAVSAAAWALRSTERDTFPVEEQFDRVEVEVGAGRVHVEALENGTAEVVAETEASLFRAAEVSHSVDDGTLVVTGSCSRGFWLIDWGGCSTHVTLRLPSDVEVVAHSSAGRVTASGLTGAADLRSSAGRVEVADHTGPLRARSSAGRVEVTGLTSDDAEVSSQAGSVDVQTLEPPRRLDVSSSAGSVTVTLPDGVAYAVDAETSAGSTSVEVPTDPSSEYQVNARSSAGSVTVRPGS